MPEGIEKKLKALILLMVHSGIRISDAVMFDRTRIKKGKLFLRQAKTKHPVWVPLPEKVLKALRGCDEGAAFYFYNGIGKPKTAITEWHQRLKLVYTIAGIPGSGCKSHRLRDAFSVNLLERGVSIETVSKLLGQKKFCHYSEALQSLDFESPTIVGAGSNGNLEGAR